MSKIKTGAKTPQPTVENNGIINNETTGTKQPEQKKPAERKDQPEQETKKLSLMVFDEKTGKKIDLYTCTGAIRKRLSKSIVNKELTGLNEIVKHINAKILFPDLVSLYFHKLNMSVLTVAYLSEFSKKDEKTNFLAPVTIETKQGLKTIEKLHHVVKVKTGTVKTFEKQIKTIKGKDRIVSVEIEKPVYENKIQLRDRFSFQFCFECFEYQLSKLEQAAKVANSQIKRTK